MNTMKKLHTSDNNLMKQNLIKCRKLFPAGNK